MDDLILLNGDEIANLLDGREAELIARVRLAYELHRDGATVLPPSSFLRIPHDPRSRIIALPAVVGGERPLAGLKWIASFPNNLRRGMERASAIIILNSMETGAPIAVLEGSVVSAKRTAASAALAAAYLHASRAIPVLGLVGCGRINFEIAKFVSTTMEIDSVLLFDLDPDRARAFARGLAVLRRPVKVAARCEDVLAGAPLVSFATTAATPHVGDLSPCPPGATLLNISLRDFTPECVLQADNVVDDLEQVCRENTSIHLASMLTGDRNFVRCTLADVTQGHCTARRDAASPVVFSPFGLGILDLTLADYALALAKEAGKGKTISDFQPTAWLERAESRT